ncbi:endonuclease domain-containing protein [Demequina sp. NBRC 110055]|uniref:endonuclease domain-containing protein n=1 Tax=Demequina sp. NBRC 110055 TaxID=1570344 RepID=UPI0011855E46|nr:hypothetical protein [Demequina sp. NBRC 110055]
MDPVRAVMRLGGAARRGTLLAQGVTRRAIDAAVRDGALCRPFTGVLALPHAYPYAAQACYFDARVSCVSAVRAHGLRLLDPAEDLHLEIAAARGGTASESKAREGVVLHRTRSHRQGSRIVPVARALDMMSHCVSPLAQLVAIDHALARGDLRRSEMADFTVTPLTTRRWLEHAAEPGAGSVPETCARVAMRAAGLHVEVQASLGNGKRADFLVEGVLYVEIDGKSYHSDPGQFTEDRRRDRRIVAEQKSVIRFAYADAVYHPDRLVADVLACLEAIRTR